MMELGCGNVEGQLLVVGLGRERARANQEGPPWRSIQISQGTSESRL